MISIDEVSRVFSLCLICALNPLLLNSSLDFTNTIPKCLLVALLRHFYRISLQFAVYTCWSTSKHHISNLVLSFLDQKLQMVSKILTTQTSAARGSMLHLSASSTSLLASLKRQNFIEKYKSIHKEHLGKKNG